MVDVEVEEFTTYFEVSLLSPWLLLGVCACVALVLAAGMALILVKRRAAKDEIRQPERGREAEPPPPGHQP
jgi:hypothetical protein